MDVEHVALDRSLPDNDISTSHFLDLPNELLLNICSHLGTREWYNLALLCHRLNALALGLVYLPHYGVNDPTSNVDIRITEWVPAKRARTAELDCLYALEVLPHLVSIKDLTCHLEGPSFDRKHVNFLPRKMIRLSRFIARLSQVDQISLFLDRIVDLSPPDDTICIPDSQMIAWAEITGKLFSDIIERKCISFKIQYGSYLQDEYVFHPVTLLSRPISSLSHSIQRRSNSQDSAALLHGNGWELFRRNAGRTTLPQSQLSREAKSSCALRSLSIHSTLLLLPPCLTWTISLIYAGKSITSLSIGYINFSSGDMWEAILPLISDGLSKQLTELTILDSCINLATDHILDFLCNFPHLISLCIGHGHGFSPKPRSVLARHLLHSEPPIPKLDHLEILRAPAKFVSHFLGIPSPPSLATSSPRCLPMLHTLSIYSTVMEFPSSAFPLYSIVDHLRSQERTNQPVTIEILENDVEIQSVLPVGGDSAP